MNGGLKFWQFAELSESLGALILGQTNGLIFVIVRGEFEFDQIQDIDWKFHFGGIFLLISF